MQAKERIHLNRIDPQLTLRERVHKALRMAIISGHLPNDRRLNERALAEDLGVSTTPVKEALKQLESEGLVSTLPRRGVVVLYGRQRAEEMILARAALESMIAHLASRRIGDKDRAELSATLSAMEEATQLADIDRLIALNETFHDCIHRASKCDYLSILIERQQFHDATTRRVIHSVPEERQKARDEHIEIGKAILAGNADAAERAMRAHVIRSGDTYLLRVFPGEAENDPLHSTGSEI